MTNTTICQISEQSSFCNRPSLFNWPAFGVTGLWTARAHLVIFKKDATKQFDGPLHAGKCAQIDSITTNTLNFGGPWFWYEWEQPQPVIYAWWIWSPPVPPCLVGFDRPLLLSLLAYLLKLFKITVISALKFLKRRASGYSSNIYPQDTVSLRRRSLQGSLHVNNGGRGSGIVVYPGSSRSTHPHSAHWISIWSDIWPDLSLSELTSVFPLVALGSISEHITYEPWNASCSPCCIEIVCITEQKHELNLHSWF